MNIVFVNPGNGGDEAKSFAKNLTKSLRKKYSGAPLS